MSMEQDPTRDVLIAVARWIAGFTSFLPSEDLRRALAEYDAARSSFPPAPESPPRPTGLVLGLPVATLREHDTAPPAPALKGGASEDDSEKRAAERVERAIEKGRLDGRAAGSAGWSRLDKFTFNALVAEMDDAAQEGYDEGQDDAREDECKKSGLLACAADWLADGQSFADWIEHAKIRHECKHHASQRARGEEGGAS